MQGQVQRLMYLFRAVVPAGVAAFLITLAGLPLAAQSSVPSSAIEAAKMPQYAQRLAHPAQRPISHPSTTRQVAPNLAPLGAPVYDNGPIDGNTNAWIVNFGFVVSNTIDIVDATSITGMTFGGWIFPGDVLLSIELSITSQPNGGITYFDQFITPTQSDCRMNQIGYNVCTETLSGFSTSTLPPGTYWVNLQNGVINPGDPMYWDQNSGVGCTSQGCPSIALQNGSGPVPSESFTLFGNNPPPPACFQSQGNLQILFSFTREQAGNNGLSGVTTDRAGNLYGTTANGGDNNAGYAYKLSHLGGWLLDPLYSFLGGSNGSDPVGAIIGPNGSLYGGAQGGIPNCGINGSGYCGLVFNLRPQPTACRTSLCKWRENVPYRFSSESDGSGTINVTASDGSGNLYGTTSSGGTFDAGTVFQLTPSGGGWTKTTLYNFTGGSDGSSPIQVLFGDDGNLYGIATGGAGVVFELTPSSGHWTQSVLYDFQSSGAFGPAYLQQDAAGNLYGMAVDPPYGTIFTLQKSNSGWQFSDYFISHGDDIDYVNNLTIDAMGNLYGTGAGGTQILSERGNPAHPGQLPYYSYIFKAWYASDGWHYEDLDYLGYQYFPAAGSLAVDSSGNLYGTTNSCGSSNAGTVWQLAP